MRKRQKKEIETANNDAAETYLPSKGETSSVKVIIIENKIIVFCAIQEIHKPLLSTSNQGPEKFFSVHIYYYTSIDFETERNAIISGVGNI